MPIDISRTWYPMLRFFAVVIAFVGWLVWKMVVKKQPWKEIKGDAFVVVLFLVAMGGVFYWLMH
jgi:hypothetical protein